MICYPDAKIPYGRQCIEDDDVSAVIEVLRSDWLTTGPKVDEFEKAFAKYVGVKYAVAVSSGTAALHCATYSVGIGPGDEVIVPAMTFVATANCVVYQGGTPVIVDVDPDTLLIDPSEVESHITPKTKAIIAVDYAGQPCDYDALHDIARRYNLILIADACHSLGASYKGRSVGGLADLSAFSFHPVKPITTGEGGMITTDDEELARRMRQFRNHGISKDHRQREVEGTWFYEMSDIGYNYRLTDFQCALGLKQLQKLEGWTQRRREIASRYAEALASIDSIRPLKLLSDRISAWHLYVVRINLEAIHYSREELFASIIDKGVRVNVHYLPLHIHPFFQRRSLKDHCVNAEDAYKYIMSIPIHPMMDRQDVEHVISCLGDISETEKK